LCTDAALLLLLHVREQRARTQVWLDCEPYPVNRVHHNHHRRCCYHQQCFVVFQQLNLCSADLFWLEIYSPLSTGSTNRVQVQPCFLLLPSN